MKICRANNKNATQRMHAAFAKWRRHDGWTIVVDSMHFINVQPVFPC